MDAVKKIQVVAVIGLLSMIGTTSCLVEETDADDEKIYTQQDLDNAVLNATTQIRDIFKYTQDDYDRALNTVPPGYVPESDVHRLVNERIAAYKANAHLVDEWYFYATIVLLIAVIAMAGALAYTIHKKHL